MTSFEREAARVIDNNRETIVRSKINRICIKDVLHVSKLQAHLLMMKEIVSNDL